MNCPDCQDAGYIETSRGPVECDCGLNKCEFCNELGQWPNVFKAGPYWTHEPCLIKAVEEGRRN